MSAHNVRRNRKNNYENKKLERKHAMGTFSFAPFPLICACCLKAIAALNAHFNRLFNYIYRITFPPITNIHLKFVPSHTHTQTNHVCNTFAFSYCVFEGVLVTIK